MPTQHTTTAPAHRTAGIINNALLGSDLHSWTAPAGEGTEKDGRGVAGPRFARGFHPGHPPNRRTPTRQPMETRTINGRLATDRRGAAEITGLSYQTIRLYASPTNRAAVGFPAPLTDNLDNREWYPVDELKTCAAHLAAKNTPTGAPDWLRDGEPDELLPATEFRRAANINQGTWKRYVQQSLAAWEAGKDGYLPKPDDEEDYRGTGKRYFWKRHRIIHWLDNRPGQTAAGKVGRKPGPPAATVDDAITALQNANGTLSGTQLAVTLNISLPTAYRLLRQARDRLDEQQEQQTRQP